MHALQAWHPARAEAKEWHARPTPQLHVLRIAAGSARSNLEDVEELTTRSSQRDI